MNRVIVAGGGPAGLAAAVELGRRGVPVTVVEPRPAIDQDRPRAKTTSMRTMEHLRRWGLADRLRAAAPLPVSWSQDVLFCTNLLGVELTRFPNAFGLHPDRDERWAEPGQQVPQPIVELLLREAVAELPAVTLLTGRSVTAIDQDGDGVRATLSDGSTLEGAYLLGCDGAAGVSREAIGASYEGSSGERPNLSVVFHAPGLAQKVPLGPAVQYWVIHPEVSGLMGRMDLDDKWWAILVGVDVRTSVPDPERLVRVLIGPDMPIDMPIEVVSTDPWVARMLLADRYSAGRVFLVGDAAHLNPPWGGHGFNTCVGDAVNIAWKLAAVLQGWGGPALLASYEAERRPVAAQTIADSSAQEKLLAPRFADRPLTGSGPEADRARAETAAALRVKAGEFYSEGLVLGYHYADSPIVADDGSPVPPHTPQVYHGSGRPGARLPHAWLPGGRSLYDALGEGLTLLCLAPEPAAPFEEAARALGVPLTVVDLADAGLLDRYGAPLVLVRPDQHVAWRGGGGDPAAILRAVLGFSDG